jgi:hypothetical protein
MVLNWNLLLPFCTLRGLNGARDLLHFGNHCRVFGDIVMLVIFLQISKVLITSIIIVCLVKSMFLSFNRGLLFAVASPKCSILKE